MKLICRTAIQQLFYVVCLGLALATFVYHFNSSDNEEKAIKDTMDEMHDNHTHYNRTILELIAKKVKSIRKKLRRVTPYKFKYVTYNPDWNDTHFPADVITVYGP